MLYTSTHSVMFHHFHGDNHPQCQGSITASQLRKMIDWLAKHYTLLGASDYCSKIRTGSIQGDEICLSFDDALKCQYDIARPVLQEKGIDAFFFVYSSPFLGKPDYLEVYRYFRSVHFSSLECFYRSFFEIVESQSEKDYAKALAQFNNIDYLHEFPFYTDDDRWFRYLRDRLLGKENYDKLMVEMMRNSNFETSDAMSALWMSNDDVLDLFQAGHRIGLHSTNHPTMIQNLSAQDQHSEYKDNKAHLESIIGHNIDSMSHPCGNYNETTLRLLEDLGITIGFRSSMKVRDIKSHLEIPREDHANILALMNS